MITLYLKASKMLKDAGYNTSFEADDNHMYIETDATVDQIIEVFKDEEITSGNLRDGAVVIHLYSEKPLAVVPIRPSELKAWDQAEGIDSGDWNIFTFMFPDPPEVPVNVELKRDLFIEIKHKAVE